MRDRDFEKLGCEDKARRLGSRDGMDWQQHGRK